VDIAGLETPYGDFTEVKAKVESREGVIRIYPVTALYAGGKVESGASIDMTNLKQISTAANFSAEKVEASPILSKFTESGNIFDGLFDLNGTGRVNIAPGIDPVNSLHARYSINSSEGTVDFSKYLSTI
jgi:hypothetical protein